MMTGSVRICALILLGTGAQGFAAVDSASSSQSPETMIQVSIGDLIPRLKSRATPPAQPAKLPPSYGKKVAEAIERARPTLEECFEAGEATTVEYEMNIRISASGQVRATKQPSSDRSPIPACISHEISRIAFPPHLLKEDVLVKIPIRIKRVEL